MLSIYCFSKEKNTSVFLSLIFAKEVLYIFENAYPKDMRPRKAIEAAETWLNDRTEVNFKTTRELAYSAYSAATVKSPTHIAHAALHIMQLLLPEQSYIIIAER